LSGKNKNAVETLRRQVEEMLQNGEVPPPPFSDFGALKGAATHPNRHKCVLLPLDAVLDALSES
jgi:NifU-like protein involved in Fe-S cluster formation